MRKTLPVSVVIPARNESRNLKVLIDQINSQTYSPVEIIVADANSSDDTREVAKRLGARVVKGGIPSIGRNSGARVASGEYILFLDADVQISSETFLKDIYDSFCTSNLDCATCYFRPNTCFRNFLGYSLTWFFNRVKYVSALTSSKWMKFDWGILMFVKKSVILEVGGFREDMRYLEDSKFISDLVFEGHRYDVLPVYVDIDLTRELSGNLKKSTKLILAAIFGIISLNSRNRDIEDYTYNKAQGLYGCSDRNS